MADELSQSKAAYSAALQHEQYVRGQTNDPGQRSDAARGTEAARQRYNAVQQSQPKPAAPTSNLPGALGKIFGR